MKKILLALIILLVSYNSIGQCHTQVNTVTLNPIVGTSDIEMSINSSCCEVHHLGNYEYLPLDNIVNICFVDTGLLLPTTLTNSIVIPNANANGPQTIVLNSYFSFNTSDSECFLNTDSTYNQTIYLSFDGPLVQPRIFTLENISYQKDKITLFPNPNKGTFSLNIPNNLSQVSINIFDVSGKMIYSLENYNSGEVISINNIEKGIYLLKVEQNKSIETIKFVIN